MGLALVFGLFAQFGPRFSIACGIETCIIIHLLAMQLEVSVCVILGNEQFENVNIWYQSILGFIDLYTYSQEQLIFSYFSF